jgi:hypothetical protein
MAFKYIMYTLRAYFFYCFLQKLQTARSCPAHLPHTRGERLAPSSFNVHHTATTSNSKYTQPTTKYAQSTTQYETSAPWVDWLAAERSIG